MSNRLDQEREAQLQPRRMQFAKESLRMMGFMPVDYSNVEIRIQYKGSVIRIFPYSGWFTGKTVEDGRGIHNLIKQLI